MADLQWHELELTKAPTYRERADERNDKKFGF